MKGKCPHCLLGHDECFCTKKCQMCHTHLNLTRDHIIPRWLISKLPFFGMDPADYKGKNSHVNRQYLCAPCNGAVKGGTIDWDNEIVRSLMKKIADKIYENLDSG